MLLFVSFVLKLKKSINKQNNTILHSNNILNRYFKYLLVGKYLNSIRTRLHISIT